MPPAAGPAALSGLCVVVAGWMASDLASPTLATCEKSFRLSMNFAPGPRSRVRSHCRFRKRGIEYVSDSGMKWMSGNTKRQCDRALPRVAAWRPLAD
jgi:hypothetical protein